MVRLITFLRTALLLAAVVRAAPTRKRDSAVGDEVAVSAPNGTPQSDLAALSTQLASATSVSVAAPLVTPPPSSSDDSSSDESDESSSSDSSDDSSSDDTSSDSSDDSSYGSVSSGGSSGYDSSSDSSYGSVSSGGSSYNYPQYGSGGSSWQSGYNDCVQQCMATYQPPPSVYYPPTSTSSYGGYQGDDSVSSGSSDDSDSADVVGATVTHTIIVAPTQGVLRYVPFLTNASVGDILEFQWGAGPHTVTRSSELTICNKTLASDVFASGIQNKSFIFHEVVNDTNPIFFYCGIPTHCEKGMFGIVNPPNAGSSATTVASLMPQWAAADPDVNAALDFVTSKTAGTAAANWGDSTDVGGIDSDSYPELARNVLYTRYFISLNPDSLDAEGNFRPSANLKIPADFSSLLAQASAGSNGTNGTSTEPTGSASAPAASMTGSAMSGTPGYGTPNGAASLSSSTVTVAVAAIAAAFFAL